MSVTYYNDLEQGSEEWKELRLSYLTGTDAYSLLKGKDPDDILLAKLVGNSFKGNRSTRRGHRLEPEAVALLEAIEDVKVHHTGFITNDKYPCAGYSPDGLIGDDGIVECKAFSKDRHLSNGERPDTMIIAQIQWGMFVSERKWAFLVFYNPDLDPEDAIIIKRIERNEVVMKRFESLIKDI